MELLEKHGVVANTNLHVLNTNWPKPAKALQLVIDNPVAQGSFKIGQAYKVEFTEISGDVVQEPSSA